MDLSNLNCNLYFHDLPFEETLENKKIIWNMLGKHIQAIAIEWGFSDTVFKDAMFTEIVARVFNMTTKEYYASEIYSDFHKDKIYFDLDSWANNLPWRHFQEWYRKSKKGFHCGQFSDIDIAYSAFNEGMRYIKGEENV